MIYRRVATIFLIGLIAAAACTDEADPIAPAPPIVAAIRLPVDSIGLYPGETRVLDAVVVDSNGIVIPDAAIAWSVSVPGVVHLDSTGVLTALESRNGAAHRFTGFGDCFDSGARHPLHAGHVVVPDALRSGR